MWMTNGKSFNIKLTQFVKILGLSPHLEILKKLHSGWAMALREMTPMYIPNSDFRAPKVDGLLPHFLVLHRMMRRTLAPRIGYSEAIPAYERNLLDGRMKHERFDVFEYIVDEIWNIATNPQRSCGFASYIQFMIEVVSHEKFYKDVAHEQLRPVVPKDPKTDHIASPPPAMAPSRTTHSGSASSSSSTNPKFLKMFRGIFTMCHRTDQRMDVIEQQMRIVHHNQEIIHSEWDEPFLEFLNVPIYPPADDPYASLTPTELTTFVMWSSRAPTDNNDDDDEEAANDDEEMEDDELSTWRLHFFESFPFLVSWRQRGRR
jgi:hypothetical protein